MGKKWSDYIDKHGLIIGINPSYDHPKEFGDTLQRCGMWFLLCLKRMEIDDYVEENFGIKTVEALSSKFFDMYYACCVPNYELPIRHPDYYTEDKGTGKTSRDQMMSNLWALLVIATGDEHIYGYENQQHAKMELESLWKRLKKNFFLLPANDILAPEHLSVFWRYFAFQSKSKWELNFYESLISFGDFHNYLSSVWKVREAKKTPYHTDDVNRICMVIGPNVYRKTSWSEKSLKKYFKDRPAYQPHGDYYHGKPASEFIKITNMVGANYAMKYYCIGQEAPWDELFHPVAVRYFKSL